MRLLREKGKAYALLGQGLLISADNFRFIIVKDPQ